MDLIQLPHFFNKQVDDVGFVTENSVNPVFVQKVEWGFIEVGHIQMAVPGVV